MKNLNQPNLLNPWIFQSMKLCLYIYLRFTKRRIALKILYTGWDYSGLARQDSSKCTIAENLIAALCKCRLIEDPGAIGFAVCGRTDKGVSGLSQV